MAGSAHTPPGALQLISDYEEMRSLMTYGLYVIPDSIDLSLWHGLINVREGRYDGGSFRFIICAHPLYPADGARPLVVFLDKPYHPLVDSITGALQIEARFTTWRGGVDRLPPVVELLREVLTTDLVLVPPSGKAYNHDAAKLYRTNTTEFDSRARRSAVAASASAIKRGHALSPPGIGGQMFPPTVYSRSYLPGADRGDDTLTAVVSGVEYTADGGDRFAYERSPYTAAVAVVGASGTLSTDGQRVAMLATAIGRARGFRLTEPTATHETLLAEIQSGQYSGSEYSDLLLRGVPSFLEDAKVELAEAEARAAEEVARRARASTAFSPRAVASAIAAGEAAGGASRRASATGAVDAPVAPVSEAFSAPSTHTAAPALASAAAATHVELAETPGDEASTDADSGDADGSGERAGSRTNSSDILTAKEG